MPVFFKDYNIDVAGDGFDPLIPYQMVPIDGSRDFTVQTGDFPAELTLKQTNFASMSNFRVIRTAASPAQVSGLPGPFLLVQRTMIPPRSVIKFDLNGHAAGAALLEGRDVPGGGRPPLQPDFRLVVSVKRRETRNLALCHVFDQVNRDVGKRLDITPAFRSANGILMEQSNFDIVNIDAASPRSITMSGSSGKTFDFVSETLIRRLIKTFEKGHPGVFARTHAVMFVFKVPLKHTFPATKKAKDKKSPTASDRTLGFNLRVQSSSGLINTVLIGRLSASELPLLGAVLAHEIGHSLGLQHLPEKSSGTIPNLDVPGRPQMDLFMHNLMFPFARFRFARLNGFQVERLHLKPALTPLLII